MQAEPYVMSSKTNTPSEAYTMTAQRKESEKQELSWVLTRARSPNGENSMATTMFFILTRHRGEVKEN
jgi:hypothetical protein